MKIKSAKFIRGVTGTDEILEDGVPQVAFIGRSNVGKSSTINSLVGQKDLARTSSFPGRTQELNVFLITPEKGSPFYLVDLPGYGFAKGAISKQEQILKLIRWYLTDSGIEQKKVVLIIDASVGATANDLEMFRILQVDNKDIVVVANKIDKIKKSEYIKQLRKINDAFLGHKVIPFSAEKKIGVGELVEEISK